MTAGQTVFALVVSLAAACDPARGPAPPAPAPEPKQAGGCAYEERTGQCHLVGHETVSANDGIADNVIVRGTFEWTASPPGVTGFVEWRLTRDRAAEAEAYLAGHVNPSCTAEILIRGSCPPQSSHVKRIDISPP